VEAGLSHRPERGAETDFVEDEKVSKVAGGSDGLG